MADRMRRVNESVRQVLSEGVGQLKDPRIGFVTVTGVRTSADLRHAQVGIDQTVSGRIPLNLFQRSLSIFGSFRVEAFRCNRIRKGKPAILFIINY